MNQPMEQQSNWLWPESDEPVDLKPYVLREWTEHHGDSSITLARPRKRRGAAVPEPAYLLKEGTDAIGERVYSLLARFLNLPSAVITWAFRDLPVAAIRFESTAWSPDRMDTELGVTQTGDRIERLVNSQDYYRHLALYQLLDEIDSFEFMVRDNVLFRIDAASAGDALWSLMMMTLSTALAEKKETDNSTRYQGSIRTTAGRLRAQTLAGYSAYMETLAHVASHPEWDEAIAHDLRMCPANAWRIDLRMFPTFPNLPIASQAAGRAWSEQPVMGHIADAYLSAMARQRTAIQQLIAEGGFEDVGPQ